jgi:hypothetical protein
MDDGDLNKSVDQSAPVAESHLPKTSRFENDDAHMSPRLVVLNVMSMI